jgi:hypothetical protein
MHAIDADCESTWPEALLQGLTADQDALAAFQNERERIDRLAEDDPTLRWCRPSNPHQTAWDSALALARRTTVSSNLLGRHATRLMEHEVEQIKQSGLELLSVELLQRRLAAAQNVGALTAQQVTRLRGRHQAGDDNRSGMTAFCFTRAQFKDQTAIERLFRSWGGEALYNSHEDDKETGPLLRSLGSPCIVVAALRVADVNTYRDIGERLMNVWCARRGIITELGPEFNGRVRTRTPAENIIKIIRFDDQEFLALTRHDRWPEPLS